MRIRHRFALAAALLLAAAARDALALEVHSPDGRIAITLELRDLEGATACPTYSVTFKGRPIILPSQLALTIRDGPLGQNLQILRHTLSSRDDTWKPVYGERSEYRDHYNQLLIELKETAPAGRLLTLTLRAYNEGAALRYTLPAQPGIDSLTITAEQTEFRMSADHPVWRSATAQGIHERVPLSQLPFPREARGTPRPFDGRTDPGVERPLTLEIARDIFAAIAEARQLDYPRMKLVSLPGKPNSLLGHLATPATVTLPFSTPWRTIMLADSPAQLLEQNHLLLNLSDPCAIADTSWIKPGKVIRETSLSTRGAKALIDFASSHNIQYILFDAGWYGPEGAAASDPRQVAVNPDRPQGGLDLHEVIRYGNDRQVGVILYVNRIALRRDLDDIIPLYRQWGVKGIKFGFIDVGSQEAIEWLYDAVRKCADAQLMVDAHDEYRPTGWNRTFPNFLTQEGIGGDETSPSNTATLANLFTRMLAGAADHTHCYFDARIDPGLPVPPPSAAGAPAAARARMGTHGFQLAKLVCFYSPWQFLFWYDRTAAVSPNANGNNVLLDVPEMEFFAAIPTVWDDTRILRGEIGENAIVARRSGPDWFVGIMNANTPRTFELPLDFLETGDPYMAHVYTDDPALESRTRIRIERIAVTRATTLRFPISAKGGAALRIVPSPANAPPARR